MQQLVELLIEYSVAIGAAAGAVKFVAWFRNRRELRKIRKGIDEINTKLDQS